MSNFTIGQRWISEAEPELGLGTVLRVEPGRVNLVFPASGDVRQYAADNAPLKRVRFRKGDQIKSHDGAMFLVADIEEKDGLFTYLGKDGELPETLLSDSISFSKPNERLLNGQVDESRVFDLRFDALNRLHEARKSSIRGFVGGRIDLIPHQLYIAHEVTSRHVPRVLLADEVGLGKTVEACLILHRLLVSGRVNRALILLPDSLIHQWFVEMLRRFNLWFNIFDEERCASIEASNPEANPFLDDQLILCGISLLANDEKRGQQAVEAGWDFLIIDEAHHLEWSREAASKEYALAERLAGRSSGLLLLTATPEQLGEESHFGRLRLLDPDRYHDLDTFLGEADTYTEVAQISGKLLDGAELTDDEKKRLADQFHFEPERIDAGLTAIRNGHESAAREMIGELLDRHGTGRVMFRNTRTAMKGFPKRIACPVTLKAHERADIEEMIDNLSVEFAVDAGDKDLSFTPNFTDDVRIDWLVTKLRKLDGAKALLICRTREKVLAIDAALRERVNASVALFHEELTLVQRDRNAAWFAEESGAQLMICSEIGSEGRNFQFAQNLILFDLPLNPELLEQRIGRLDRIGQRADIQIHIPVLSGSPQEALLRWYHEGVDAFQRSQEAGNELLKRFGRRVNDLAMEFPVDPEQSRAELEELIEETRVVRTELRGKLEQGRDRLLEMNSFRPERATQLVDAIRATDSNGELEDFMLRMFDHFGIHFEEMAGSTYKLGTDGMVTDGLPGLLEEGMVATFDRARAVAREEVAFLSEDHPIVTGSLDLLLGSEQGNSAFAVWEESGPPSILLEAIFVLECVAPGWLQADRFLAPAPIRVVVDFRQADRTEDLSVGFLNAKLTKGDVYGLIDNDEFARTMLPEMIDTANELAEERGAKIKADALANMESTVGSEITRLKALKEKNDSIRADEIEAVENEANELRKNLFAARLRLDSIRLIQKRPV